MKRMAIAVAAATFGLSTIGSHASAETMSSGNAPIRVLNLQYQDQVNDYEEYGAAQDVQPGIMLTFKDVSAQTVRSVIFAINDASGHQLGTVSRHGTFSPGVSITRYFGDVQLKDKHGLPATATPIEVQFKDGTVWSSPK